jgi:hypothetical protein
MIRRGKREVTTVAYELTDDGVLRPYHQRIPLGLPARPGRKPPTERYAIETRRARAAQALQERLARSETILPPSELRSLPLCATYLLYVAGADLRDYLTPATWLLHRKLIRQHTDLDIAVPLREA